jgi:hypothetical protein
MPNELIRPIDPDSAHALEESAKAVAKAIDAAVQAGKYVGEVLGDLPHDLVGIMGDWVKQKRARRWAELSADTDKTLRDRGIENREDVSPSVAIPLIAAAINEDRDVLKQLWAKLLAAAMDPHRANLVRSSMIEVLRRMDPLDAAVLRCANATGGGLITNETRIKIASELGASRDETDVSIANLQKLELVVPTNPPNAIVSPLGREFLRAVAD